MKLVGRAYLAFVPCVRHTMSACPAAATTNFHLRLTEGVPTLLPLQMSHTKIDIKS